MTAVNTVHSESGRFSQCESAKLRTAAVDTRKPSRNSALWPRTRIRNARHASAMRIIGTPPKRNRQMPLAQASVVGGRRQARRLAERSRERARFAEAYRHADLGDRTVGFRQQGFGTLDAPTGVIAMRRHPEGFLERPAHVVRAQSDELRQLRKRNPLGQVLFDVVDQDSLLPG